MRQVRGGATGSSSGVWSEAEPVRAERFLGGPSTAELGGNLLGFGDGRSDTHGPAAARADGDVDAEDSGEELHPGKPRRGSITELSVEQGGDGGELELAAGMKSESCLGSGSGWSQQRTTAERKAWWAESTP